jgi:phosphoglycolate phosphatase-like HAD superfamily hydrolase
MDRIKYAKVLFWDFDGVIKDSVEVKSNAFEQLFELYGKEVSQRVRNHHEMNGGISRFDKLPVYLEWSGQSSSPSLVEEYSDAYSRLVKQNVINSDWVPGVIEYIELNSKNQVFFLVTATPQKEIEEILNALKLSQYFHKVFGAPTTKTIAIKNLLAQYSIRPDQSLMIGDTSSDLDAASINQVPFVLRRTNLNKYLQETLTCKMIEDFCNE